jgi:diguanylate cyclase (GGDEF)-like protein
MDLVSSGLWDNPLRVAASLAHAVARERDPEQMRELIITHSGQLLDADLVRLFEPTSDGALQYSRSWGTARLPKSAIEMERELLERALEQERSLLSTHPALDPALHQLAARCQRDHAIVHALLIRGGRATQGAACVHWLGRERPSFERRVGFQLYWDQIGLTVAALRERLLVEQELGRLHRLALRDDLTGLPNGRALNGELQRRFDRGIPFGLLVIDFDGMRHANNELGFQAGGDVLIHAVGNALPQLLGADEFAARLHTAGDEFACITDADDDQAAAQRAAQLEHDLNQLDVPITHRSFYRGASVGHTVAVPGDTPATITARASASMRQRKQERYRQATREPDTSRSEPTRLQ